MKKDWDSQALIIRLETKRNPALAAPMERYMRNNFPFLGIKTPLRKTLLKEHFAEYQLPEPQQLKKIVWELYQLPEREYQYVAMALLEKMKHHLTTDDLPFMRQLIESKSWWDSVDVIAPRIAGHVVMEYRVSGTAIMLEWSDAENIWTNRAAILHQLKFKSHTDTALLSSIILAHAGSSEFFLQKSIGWALREYAKTDPVWVHDFVSTHALKPLSKREALKNLKK